MTVVALVLSVIALVVAVAALAKRPKPTAWPKPGDDLDSFFPTEIRLHGSGPDGAWVSEPQPVHWGRVSGGLVNGSAVRFDVIPPNTRLTGMELHPGPIPGKLDEPAGPFDFETSYTVTPTLHAPTKPTRPFVCSCEERRAAAGRASQRRPVLPLGDRPRGTASAYKGRCQPSTMTSA